MSTHNVKVISFPSNTSQYCNHGRRVFRDLDKSKARHESLSDALGVSLGTLCQNERALYTSLKAQEKAMTEKVIQASFRNLGIFPWDPSRALANARSATLLDTFLPAEQETCELFMARYVIAELALKLKPDVKLEHKMIQTMNTPQKLETLKDWARKPPRKKVKLTEPSPLPILSLSSVESNDTGARDESSDDEEMVPVLPQIH